MCFLARSRNTENTGIASWHSFKTRDERYSGVMLKIVQDFGGALVGYYYSLKTDLVNKNLPRLAGKYVQLLHQGDFLSYFEVEKVSFPWQLPSKTKEISQSEFPKLQVHTVSKALHVIADFELEYSNNVLFELRELERSLPNRSRVYVTSYSRIWTPLVLFSEKLKLKTRKSHCFLPINQLSEFMEISGFSFVKNVKSILIPFYIPVLSNWINRWIAPLPIIRKLCILNLGIYVQKKSFVREPSVSIVIAARNEEGNIVELMSRIPKLASNQEVIFVEGNSNDQTWSMINQSLKIFESKFRVRAFKQYRKGKSDAVHMGILQAQNDLIMILDADMSVPPEALADFYETMLTPGVDFCNGTRFIYPQESGAMRRLNFIGNVFFSKLISYLIGQPISDSLCGTKVFWRDDYHFMRVQKDSSTVQDPFGDFDFLIGASKANLRIVNVPVNYRARTYGQTNISRFTDAIRLLKYCYHVGIEIKFSRATGAKFE
jgi:hypothetical protein